MKHKLCQVDSMFEYVMLLMTKEQGKREIKKLGGDNPTNSELGDIRLLLDYP